jgi:mRNA-degrading endonuclease RelE of RelBE toxin-antitoxin system
MSDKPLHIGFAPAFRKRLKDLRKKYPNVYADLQTLVTQLEQGENLGDQIQGIGYPVYKIRLKNSDLARGKSGGYRVIYYLKTTNFIVLLTIYAKTQQVDITVDEIRRLIKGYELSE